jgi:hypothetical protein
MSTLRKTLPAVAALGVSALFLAAPQAAYAADSVSCQTAGETHFTPGVQMFQQSQFVTYRGVSSSCVDHSDLGITSARITASFDDVDLSCVASRFGTGTGVATIVWDANGARQTSHADITIDDTVLNTAKVSGVVTEGPFAGQRFTGKFNTSLLTGAGKCSSGALYGGVMNAEFKGAFSIG